MQRLSLSELQRFLSEETIFNAAPPHAVDRLAALAVQKSLLKDQTLFSMGQPCEALHFVVSGCGHLVILAADGRQRLLHRALPGDMVAAVPFFDGGRYPATFVAESELAVLSFPRQDLLNLLAADGKLTFCILGGLVERLRLMVSLVEKTSFEDTTSRLWAYLVQGSRVEGDGEYPRTFEPLPTREKIALNIGTVREVVSRRLSHLVETGHASIEGRRLRLLKPLEPAR